MVESQTIAALRAVGRAIEWALEQAGIAIVNRLLKPTFDALRGEILDYSRPMAYSLVNASDGGAAGFRSAFSAPPLDAAVGLSLTVVIVLNILESLSFGIADIAALVIGLVISDIVMALKGQQNGFSPGAFGGPPTPYSQELVHELANLTDVSWPVAQGYQPVGSESGPGVGALIGAVSDVFNAVSVDWATAMVVGAFGYDPDWTTAVGLALAIDGLLISAASIRTSPVVHEELDMVSLGMDGVSLELDLLGPETSNPANKLPDGVTLVLDIATGVEDGLVLGGDLLHWW